MCAALVAGLLLPGASAFADDKKDDKDKKSAAASKKLEDKQNPELIGKRNINKGSPNFYSLEKEAALGAQLSADLDRQLKFITDPVITEYVNRVGQNIALNSDAKVPFQIKVVDSPEVNAFALPGGYFYVNKGLILAADNESQMACVMAHEIAHVCARHSTEQATKGQLFQLGMIPLIFLGGIGAIGANAANILVPLTFLKFSRGAEFEADMLGAQYAWASGYDPNAFITFFEKLKKQQNPNQQIPKIFSTHPPNDERIAKVKQLVALFPDRDEYVINSSEFQRVKARLGVIAPDVNNRRVGPGGADPGPSRPTLKRRPTDPNDTQSDDPDSYEGADKDKKKQEPANRPTLKRRTDDNPNDKSQPTDPPPPVE
jgi:predicted Zn-dependent protease